MHSTFFVKLHQGQSNLCSFARGSLADLSESTDFAGVNRVVPIIHIHNENKVRKFQLLVYHFNDGVICMLVDGQFLFSNLTVMTLFYIFFCRSDTHHKGNIR